MNSMNTNSIKVNFLFIGIFLISGCLPSFAQEGIKIGLELSPIISFARITDDNGDQFDEIDTDARLGLSYGLIINYGFTDNYGIYSGFRIVNKGFNRSQTFDDTEVRQKVRVTALEIPAALKLRTNQVANGLHIHGIFGLSFEANVGYRNRFQGLDPRETSTFGGETTGTIRDEDLIKNLTVSFIFGPGAEYDIGGVGTVTFGVIFHQMLTNINNLSSYGIDERIRINYLSFALGYLF